MPEKQNIKDVGFESLTAAVKAMALQSYVASQIIQWTYKKGAHSFEEMTNISKLAREILAEKFYISRLELVKTLESADGTKKLAWRLSDGNIIESVMIPSMPGSKVPKRVDVQTCRRADVQSLTPTPLHAYTSERLTLCISTQVGCAMGCTFCRTAGMGHVRNLTQGEILDQVLEAQNREIGKPENREVVKPVLRFGDFPVSRITNVVLMGMGEPLANYENVVGAVRIMTNTKGLCLSKRHVTISTCGLVPAIERLAGEKLGIKLAVSLNATTDESRSAIMPINKKYPLSELFKALKKYSNATAHDRLTFEYVMIEGKNDSVDDAKRLVKFLSHIPAKVNLIPLNKSFTASPLPLWEGPGGGDSVGEVREGGEAEPSIQRFAQYLRNKNIQVNIRQSRGADILAACGQLAAKRGQATF